MDRIPKDWDLIEGFNGWIPLDPEKDEGIPPFKPKVGLRD